jgi:hypothetical protein
MQSLQNVPPGAVLRLSAAIRTVDADSANVCLQCWDITREKMLAFATTPVFRGDQDWIEVSSGPIIVPADTAEIIVRAALAGLGQVWFDELAVVSEPEEGSGKRSARAAAAETSDQLDKALRDQLPGRLVESRPISQDCMVLAYLPDWQHGNVDNIAVANNDGGVRTLVAWKPLSPKLTSAPNRRFYLAVYSRETTVAEGAGAIQVCPIIEKWPELTSWKSQPKIDQSSEEVALAFAPGNGWKLFDITPLIRNKTMANRYGVMLKFQDEKQSGAKRNWSGYGLVSREGLGEGQGRHPRLLVTE